MIDPITPCNLPNYDLSLKKGSYTSFVIQQYTFPISCGPAKGESLK